MNEALKILQQALRKGASAKSLAGDTKASIPTIYRRIEALKKAGAVISESKTPRRQTGPTPTKFVLVKAAP